MLFLIAEYIPIKDIQFENAEKIIFLKILKKILVKGGFNGMTISSAKYYGMLGTLHTVSFNLCKETWYYHHSMGKMI